MMRAEDFHTVAVPVGVAARGVTGRRRRCLAEAATIFENWASRKTITSTSTTVTDDDDDTPFATSPA
jgi:hypothetical protein